MFFPSLSAFSVTLAIQLSSLATDLYTLYVSECTQWAVSRERQRK